MLAKRRETQAEREPPKIQATEKEVNKEAKTSEKMMGIAVSAKWQFTPGGVKNPAGRRCKPAEVYQKSRATQQDSPTPA